MRRLAMITTVAAIAPLSVIGVVLTATSWWEGLSFAAGILLTFGVLRQWSLDGYPRQAIFALAFTTASWIIGALAASSPIGFVPMSLVGALVLARLRRRMLWMGVLAVGVAAIGASAFLFHPPGVELALAYLVTPAAGTLFIAGVILVSEQAWMLVRRLERANEVEAELATARERQRLAADLHDIQGHSLHVIKLKAALAGRSVRTDPDRAEAELAEIRRLVDETIAATRSVAYARHELTLTAELENAKNLGEAAGIRVDVRWSGDATTGPHPLLAQVLREATTNLLRHAHPSVVEIIASPISVEVANDGVDEDAATPLRGLARLRERVEDAGGTLGVDRSAESFVVSARIAPAATAADSSPMKETTR